MAVTVAEADIYFRDNVIDDKAWQNAYEPIKDKVLNASQNILYREYPQYDRVDNPIPDEAIYEQAIWMLSKPEYTKKADYGVNSAGADGVFYTMKPSKRISPEVRRMLGRKIGRSFL